MDKWLKKYVTDWANMLKAFGIVVESVYIGGNIDLADLHGNAPLDDPDQISLITADNDVIHIQELGDDDRREVRLQLMTAYRHALAVARVLKGDEPSEARWGVIDRKNDGKIVPSCTIAADSGWYVHVEEMVRNGGGFKMEVHTNGPVQTCTYILPLFGEDDMVKTVVEQMLILKKAGEL